METAVVHAANVVVDHHVPSPFGLVVIRSRLTA